eukprot:6268840-Amphidinium_carterae.1
MKQLRKQHNEIIRAFLAKEGCPTQLKTESTPVTHLNLHMMSLATCRAHALCEKVMAPCRMLFLGLCRRTRRKILLVRVQFKSSNLQKSLFALVRLRMHTTQVIMLISAVKERGRVSSWSHAVVTLSLPMSCILCVRACVRAYVLA